MKKDTELDMDIVRFVKNDIVTASGDGNDDGGYDKMVDEDPDD